MNLRALQSDAAFNRTQTLRLRRKWFRRGSWLMACAVASVFLGLMIGAFGNV